MWSRSAGPSHQLEPGVVRSALFPDLDGGEEIAGHPRGAFGMAARAEVLVALAPDLEAVLLARLEGDLHLLARAEKEREAGVFLETALLRHQNFKRPFPCASLHAIRLY